MKRNPLKTLLLVVLAVGMGTSLAQSPEKKRQFTDDGGLPASLEIYDIDANGELSFDETQAMEELRSGLRDRRLADFDENDDGVLSGRERRQAQRSLHDRIIDRRTRHFTDADLNGDDILEFEEFLDQTAVQQVYVVRPLDVINVFLDLQDDNGEVTLISFLQTIQGDALEPDDAGSVEPGEDYELPPFLDGVGGGIGPVGPFDSFQPFVPFDPLAPFPNDGIEDPFEFEPNGTITYDEDGITAVTANGDAFFFAAVVEELDDSVRIILGDGTVLEWADDEPGIPPLIWDMILSQQPAPPASPTPACFFEFENDGVIAFSADGLSLYVEGTFIETPEGNTFATSYGETFTWVPGDDAAFCEWLATLNSAGPLEPEPPVVPPFQPIHCDFEFVDGGVVSATGEGEILYEGTFIETPEGNTFASPDGNTFTWAPGDNAAFCDWLASLDLSGPPLEPVELPVEPPFEPIACVFDFEESGVVKFTPDGELLFYEGTFTETPEGNTFTSSDGNTFTWAPGDEGALCDWLATLIPSEQPVGPPTEEPPNEEPPNEEPPTEEPPIEEPPNEEPPPEELPVVIVDDATITVVTPPDEISTMDYIFTDLGDNQFDLTLGNGASTQWESADGEVPADVLDWLRGMLDVPAETPIDLPF